MAAKGGFGLGDLGHGARRCDRCRAAVYDEQRSHRAGRAQAPELIDGAGGVAEFIKAALDEAEGFADIGGHWEVLFARHRE